jgi:hypothetical protein
MDCKLTSRCNPYTAHVLMSVGLMLCQKLEFNYIISLDIKLNKVINLSTASVV